MNGSRSQPRSPLPPSPPTGDLSEVTLHPDQDRIRERDDALAARDAALDELRTANESCERMALDLGEAKDELARLNKIESAAIAMLATMPRRNGKPFSFALATMARIIELDATIQQPEEEKHDGDK